MIRKCFKPKLGSLYIFAFVFFIQFIEVSLYAQNQAPKTHYNGLFKEVYFVNKNDTSVRHGLYNKYYKGKVIEKGRYAKDTRVGRWRYFSLNGIFEYEYNYDINELISINGQNRHDLKKKTPCLYKGSPLIPYLYLVTNLGYPAKAKEKNIEGKVVLALKVNTKGEVYGFYIAEKLHPIIDNAVMKVAKTIPHDWAFLSATYMGQPIPSEYYITIQFELE